MESQARYGRVQNRHLSNVTDVARLVPVDESAMLFPEILELHSLLIVVLTGIIEYKFILIPIDSSEFTEAGILLVPSSLLVFLK